MMTNDELYHYGVKGMKWGVRKNTTTSTSGKKRKSKKKTVAIKKALKKTKKHLNSSVDSLVAKQKANKAERAKKAAELEATKKKKVRKPISEMTDAELKAAIDRLDLEKKYKEAVNYHNPNKDRASKFVNRVLEKSGESLATQVVNHFGAKALNKMIGEEVIFANNKKK